MQTISDKSKILEAMRGFIREPKKQTAEFLYEIRVRPGATWNGWTVTPGGLQIVGARPMSLVISPQTDEHHFDLTNSDSGYSSSIGRLSLDDIESVTLLR